MIDLENLPDSKRIKLIKEMLQFHGVSSLLMHIRDIQDELSIVRSVLEQQRCVLEQLRRAIPAFYTSRWEKRAPERNNANQRQPSSITDDEPIVAGEPRGPHQVRSMPSLDSTSN
jgi:hypothetical protein